jgi:hypothetical protein
MAINKIKNIVFGCSSPIGMAISKEKKHYLHQEKNLKNSKIGLDTI